MATVRRADAADRDLDEIVRYIARDNLSATLAWLDEVERLFALLATQPEMGHVFRARRLGLVRRHVIGNYVIYFRPEATGIEVLRVIHGAREQRRLV
ncbi:MAG: type II toxin-antitoxin system RelE/ParE family toxin [Planctomycetes bacterium]|nr:type II toxin-antitoxin system RelE/ParE family toxin [Planctomycetota bacterium]